MTNSDQNLKLLKLLTRVAKLNILILHPIQKEINQLLESILGPNYKHNKNLFPEDEDWIY